MSKILIKGATIINEGRSFTGSVAIENDKISKITEGVIDLSRTEDFDEIINAAGKYLIPGVIDDHVHFREPGLTDKADIANESRAAAAGGVTSFMDMPNCIPQTVTIEALEDKFERGAKESRVNYSFYFGATNDNCILFHLLDKKRVCGIKLFMGSSTGNMLVDEKESLERIFGETDMLIAAHCEDAARINENIKKYKAQYGDDPYIIYHPMIRDAEACYASSSRAIELAEKNGARLHILHISTAKELSLFHNDKPLKEKKITAEAVISHLLFYDDLYKSLGPLIKCNPSVKTLDDREAIRQAVIDNVIDVIGTDHAPHLLSDKTGGALGAASGMPMIQFSLPIMLELSQNEVITKEQVIEKMCHAPADLYRVEKRGYIRPGYQADLVLVDPNQSFKIESDIIQSKCAWSPLEGMTMHTKVIRTLVNGHTVYQDGSIIDDKYRGMPLQFNN